MKTALFAAALAIAGGCCQESAAQAQQQRPSLEKIGTSPGGSIFFLDTASLADHPAPAGAAPETATREAIIVTDNSAYAASVVDDPTAQVSSRNLVIARCATGELRIASTTITQKDGRSKTTHYTEQQFSFSRIPEGRFEGQIFKAICAL